MHRRVWTRKTTTALLGAGPSHVEASRGRRPRCLVARSRGATYRVSILLPSPDRTWLPVVRDNDEDEMDGGQAIHGANPAASATNGPESIALNKPASPSTTNSRHSPVAPLAPLEYLQNQRRGSITDPSLHVAGASGVTNLSNSPPGGSKPASSRQPDPSATLGR